MNRGRGRSQQQLDRILQAQCHGEAWRRVTAGEPLDSIVAELRRMSGDRVNLLVEQAGITAGSWAARPSTISTELVVAAVLIQAASRADGPPINPQDLKRWVHEGWTRAMTPSHTAG